MKKLVVFFIVITTIVGYKLSHSNYLIPDKDNLIVYNGFIIKNIDEFSVSSVELFSNKVNKIIDTYLKPSNSVYYSIIPDKEYFINEKVKKPFDYVQMESILKKNVKAQYIPLFGALNLNDYYRYDHHWRQESLQQVVDTLGNQLDFQVSLSDFDFITYPSAIGVYARKNKDLIEELVYLTNDPLEQCVVDNFENKEFTEVYNTHKLNSITSYDVFLSGATPLITIQNSNSENNKRLIIFRDSFASSLAPLLANEYAEIILVDLRYMMSNQLAEFIDFSGADILFLYCSEVINHSTMLR